MFFQNLLSIKFGVGVVTPTFQCHHFEADNPWRDDCYDGSSLFAWQRFSVWSLASVILNIMCCRSRIEVFVV